MTIAVLRRVLWVYNVRRLPLSTFPDAIVFNSIYALNTFSIIVFIVVDVDDVGDDSFIVCSYFYIFIL
jgi:hypothetical protein